MKKFIYLFFIIVVGFTVHDVQKEIITLEWIEILGKEENDAYVFFENSDVLTSHSLPAYSRVYKITDSRHNAYLEVENPVFEEIQLPEHCSWANEIPDTLEVQCNGLQSREEKSTELSIVPLKREGGKIFRLKSFELKRIPRILKNANKSLDWKNSSVLSSGKWVKIGTFGKGIYKIPYSRLTEWGFTTPSEVGVFGSGATLLSENPGERAYDDLEQCAVWSNNNGGEECLFFYAPGFVEWSINDGGHFVHQLNDYATQGYFFLGEVGTAQKNIELLDEVNDPVTHNLSTFDERELHEDEINNLLHLGSGKQWFGDKFLRGIERSYSFTMLNPDVSSPAYITVNGAARSYISSSMGISANGASLGNVQFSKVNINDTYGLYASEKNKRFEFTANDGSLNVSCTYNTGNSSAEAWLDYIELFYRRNLMKQIVCE